MDWTAEDTEILQLMNRIRQVLSKSDQAGYYKFVAADPDSKDSAYLFDCRVGEFELRLYGHGRILIYHWDEGKAGFVFDAQVQRGGRPLCTWDKDIVRNRLVPALDREMVLEDLSRLGT